MKKTFEESAFVFSVVASCLPFLSVILSLFDPAEPFSLLIFWISLMEGALWGSVLGIIALICNRKKKSIKIVILSLFPVIVFFLAMITDVIYSHNMP